MPIKAHAIERLRNELGLDQEALAKAADLSQGTISRMERAPPGKPFDAGSVARVAAALGVTVDAIAMGPAYFSTAASSGKPLALIEQIGDLLDQLRAQIVAGNLTDEEARGMLERGNHPTDG
jgi:transcriptional regulator with XRE-family HTH domain